MPEIQQEIDLNKYLAQGSQPFFKAKDMATQKAKVIIKNLREVNLPNSGLTLVMDFVYKKQERSMPLNITNIKALKDKFGVSTKDWLGKEVTFIKVVVVNPKTRQEVESIRIK